VELSSIQQAISIRVRNALGTPGWCWQGVSSLLGMLAKDGRCRHLQGSSCLLFQSPKRSPHASLAPDL
jgi:hypothetical protein